MVPPLHWYCKALRLPATLPALLRFLRFAVPPLRLGLRSRSRKALRLRAWDCCPDSQTGLIDGGDRTSQVPGGPRCERALLSDPGGTSALGRYRASMLSSTNWKVSTPTTNTNFGAQSHGLPTRCLRFVGCLPHRHARLASGWLASLFRAGVNTRWVLPKGFRLFLPPFPGFAWRTQIKVSKEATPD